MCDNSKYMQRFCIVLTALFIFMAAPIQARAADKKVVLPVSAALAVPEAKQKLDGTVAFYFGNTPHGAVSKTFGNFTSNKKGNAFGSSDAKTCNHVLLSALISFQERAKSLGGDAVINLHSYYKKNEVSYDNDFECHVGAFVSGVALKGDVVKLK